MVLICFRRENFRCCLFEKQFCVITIVQKNDLTFFLYVKRLI